MRAVRWRAAAMGSWTARATSGAGSIGSPTCIRTRERKVCLASKRRPTGTIRAPRSGDFPSASRTMRAAPVLRGLRAGSLWLVPSGKRASAPPLASSSWLREKVWSFFPGSDPSSCRRWTGMAPARSRKGRTTGVFQRVLLAGERGRQGQGAPEEEGVDQTVDVVGYQHQRTVERDASGAGHLDLAEEDLEDE